MNNFIFVCLLTIITCSYQTSIAQKMFNSDSKCENIITFLKENCFSCNQSKNCECEVEEFKYLGKVNNNYYYSSINLRHDPELYYRQDDKLNFRYITIFEGINNKEKVKAVYNTGDFRGEYERVSIEFISAHNNYFIHIFISNGNGNWDFGEYFIFKKDGWYKLDVPEVADSLVSIIPKTYQFCNGSQVDLRKMTSDIAVYTPNDGCCCPSGGTARAYLKLIDNNQIIITEKRYFPDLN